MGEQANNVQVRKGEADLDLDSIPTAAHAQVTKEFGINKGGGTPSTRRTRSATSP